MAIKFKINLMEIVFAALAFLISGYVGMHYVDIASNTPSAVFYPPTKLGFPWTSTRYFYMSGFFGGFIYGIFRCICPKWLSLGAAIFLALSPMQLYILKSAAFRDYTRAPYIMAAIFGIFLAARKRGSWFTVLAAAGITGLACGLGQRHREELVFFLLPAAITLIFFTRWSKNWATLAIKTASLAILFSAFYVTCPDPIFQHTSNQSGAYLSSVWNKEMGLSTTPYDIGYLFLDEHSDSMTELMNRAAPGSIFTSFLQFFPADFLARIYGAAHRVIDLPFVFHLPPQGFETSTWWAAVYKLRSTLQGAVASFSFPVFMFSLAVLFAAEAGVALACVVLLFFMSGIFTVQFLGKHYFYSEFLAFFALCGAISLIVRQNDHLAFLQSKRFLCSVLLVVGGELALKGLLVPVRKIQQASLSHRFQQYLSAETENNPLQDGVERGDKVFIPRPAEESGTVGAQDKPEFLSAEFGGEKCSADIIWPVLRYRDRKYWASQDGGRLDWSRTLKVPTRTEKSKSVKLFFYAFKGFLGLEVPQAERNCLQSFKRIKPDALPDLLLTAIVPTGGDFGQLFASLMFGQSSYTLQPRPISAAKAVKAEISPAELEFRANIVKVADGELRVQGYAAPPVDPNVFPTDDRSRSRLNGVWHPDVSISQIDTDLFYTKPISLTRGVQVEVDGELAVGGITLGLTRGGVSEGEVTITTPGRFKAIFPIFSSGEYRLGAANNLSWYTSLENRTEIHSIRVVSH